MSRDFETKDDKFLVGLLEDKYYQALDKYIPSYSNFLNAKEYQIAKKYTDTKLQEDVNIIYYGGYDDAERKIAIFLPEYSSLDDINPLSVMVAKTKPGSKTLKHGDYLGSLLGMGISRDKIGDILVSDKGAQIIVMDSISEFILLNYNKAGRQNLDIEKIDLVDLEEPEKKVKIINDTVPSLRLDSVISSAFSLSRSKATDLIRAGKVFVDDMEIRKTDFNVKEMQKLVLRGKGKAKLVEIGNRTRKDRIFITIEKYI